MAQMGPLDNGVDNRTRLEILRLIAETGDPVGADSLLGRLAQRGITMGLDGVRYHLRVLDERGFTARISTRGRVLTEAGRRELQRSLVDARMSYALARIEVLAHQVTFDPGSGAGQVVGALTVFPEDRLPTVLFQAARAWRAGLGVSGRVALVRGGDRFGATPVPPGKAGLVTVGTVTIDGLLLSRNVMFRPTFSGVVEVSEGLPRRFVDVLEYGQGSRDPVEILTRAGSTRVLSVLERGTGLILADVREVVGVARERVERLVQELPGCGLGGVLALGQVGGPVLGVPVRAHTFGIAVAAGILPAVASYEAGIAADFYCSEALVDYATLVPVEDLLPEAERLQLPPARSP